MSSYASQRLQAIPAHLLNRLEWKASALRESGVDVIPLAFGDPDRPTPPAIVEAAQRSLLDPATHRYSNNRGGVAFRTAVASHYHRRFGVTLDAATMVLPALGAKEAIFNANLAFLDPGDVALAPDPGYQIYVAGPLLVGAQPHLLPLRADRGYVPDLTDVPADVLGKAKVLYLNYPNTPTGALAPAGFFEDVVTFAAAHDILVVHDNVYSDITFDGVVAPSFLATPGALDVAIEITSMSKTYNMTGWRCAAVAGNPDAIEAYRSMKTFIDSGMFTAVQAAAVAALDPSMDRVVADSIEIYQRRRDLTCSILSQGGFAVEPPKGGVYVWAKVPDGFASSYEFCDHVLDTAAVAVSPGSAYGPHGDGYLRVSLTVEDERLAEGLHRIVEAAR